MLVEVLTSFLLNQYNPNKYLHQELEIKQIKLQSFSYIIIFKVNIWTKLKNKPSRCSSQQKKVNLFYLTSTAPTTYTLKPCPSLQNRNFPLPPSVFVLFIGISRWMVSPSHASPPIHPDCRCRESWSWNDNRLGEGSRNSVYRWNKYSALYWLPLGFCKSKDSYFFLR